LKSSVFTLKLFGFQINSAKALLLAVISYDVAHPAMMLTSHTLTIPGIHIANLAYI